MKNMIKAGIIGATGYAGGELVRILLAHKDVEIKWYGSRSYIDQEVQQCLSEYVPAGRCKMSVRMITWKRWQIRWM